MKKLNEKDSGTKENKYWYPEDVIESIIEFLKKEFPESIIVRELDRVDIMVLREGCISVEIQRTPTNIDNPAMSNFENVTRKQVERNIEISGKCWLFFDKRVFEYLKNTSDRHIDINMKWLYQYFKDKKMRIFVVDDNKSIIELLDEDMKIFTRFSPTEMNKRKSGIAFVLLKNHRFTTEEIDHMYNIYKANRGEYRNFYSYLTRKDATDREKEYAKLIYSLGFIDGINKILDCSVSKSITDAEFKYITLCYAIGLLKRSSYRNDKYNRISFTDVDNIAEFFLGYLKNKELWDYIREHPIDNRTFYAIIKGEYPNFLRDHKNQKTIEDAWS